jgi:hypothetical protein
MNEAGTGPEVRKIETLFHEDIGATGLVSEARRHPVSEKSRQELRGKEGAGRQLGQPSLEKARLRFVNQDLGTIFLL